MGNILNNRQKGKTVYVKAINEELIRQYALEEGFDVDMFSVVENDYLDDETDGAITPELDSEINALVESLGEPAAKPASAPAKHASEHKASSHEHEREHARHSLEHDEPKHEHLKPTMRQRIRKIPYKRRMLAILLAELVLLVSMGDNIFVTVEVRNQLERQEVKAAEAAEAVAANVLPVVPSSTKKLQRAGEKKINEKWIESIRDKAANLEYVEAERDYDIENSETYKLVQGAYSWGGSVLSKSAGTVTGPNGKETYYNLNMSVIMRMMNARGVHDAYWVRSDGCKMIGNYIMVAADLDLHPRGSIVKTSKGLAMVCDTGTFTRHNRNQIDVAVSW